MSSRLRPTLVDGRSGAPCAAGGTAYLLIYESVKQSEGLIHGRLHDGHGAHCAIGNYFERNRLPLKYGIVDEVAAVNDSVPYKTPRQRKLHVLKWLRWRLASVNMPGFKA